MTKFFEPINVSATHIYHSALELCPISSAVRRLYYDRCHGITRFPRVVIGNPGSWDQTISFSDQDQYESCTWSPCGRFIAAQTEKFVEIRNQLTFQLLAVLRPPKNTPLLQGPLAYSPDGRSLACGFSAGIVIWDIQTGGVAQSIDCQGSMFALLWSLNGGTIAVALISDGVISSVKVYDVVSRSQVFESEKTSKEWFSRPWAHEKSFRLMIMPTSRSSSDLQLSIAEIGPTRIEIEPLQGSFPAPSSIGVSPSTYRISLAGRGSFCIIDARNSDRLLEEKGDFSFHHFSSDGSLLAAAHKNGFRVWKYTSGGYVLLGEFLLPHIPSLFPAKLLVEFSPNATSILSWCKNVLQVWRLHSPPTTPETCRQHVAISHSGRYIATAHQSQSTVTIVNLDSQTPRFIDTDGEIEGLVITGNVLLVVFSEEVIGWLLAEEGKVAGVVDSRRAGPSDSLWTVTSSSPGLKSLCFRVSGQVGLIGTEDLYPFVYHTGTGGVPDRVHKPQHFTLPWLSLYQPSNFQEYHHLRHHDTPPGDHWLGSRTTEKAGWVVDGEGRHRFWLPVEWRAPWDRKNCHHDITTLFTRIGDQPILIRF